MKIIALTILYCLMSVLSFPFCVNAQPLTFALIEENCILYLDEQTISPLFTLPSSYFVKILEQNDNVIKVSYLDVVGYVNKECISSVNYVPLYKFPTNTSAKVHNDGNTITVRSSPNHLKDNVCCKLEDGAIVTFYGIRNGSEQIEMLGDNWCYVKDANGNFGYVYNLYVDEPEFPTNDYEAKEVSASTSISTSISLSSTHGTILIITLSLFVLILLVVALKTVRARKE